MYMLEREAMAILVSAQGVGYVRRARALAAAGSALRILEDPYAFSAELTREGAASVRDALGSSKTMLERMKRDGIHLITQEETEYPRLLRHTAKPPHLLFCMGNPDLNHSFPMAVVGTRRASEYGLYHTRMISRELARDGMCIVSGLALGIDAAAHEGALDAQGRTVAVLGGALDQFYPMENYRLMRRMLESGSSVVSEYAPGVRPNRYSFLERNRIIAGMSLGTLVTEGPHRSGAAHTARCAMEEGREVFALPGDINREGSQLPNRLIADGAHLLTSAGDILECLVIEREMPEKKTEAGYTQMRHKESSKPIPKKAAPKAEAPEENLETKEPEGEEEKAIWRILREGEADFDTLSEKTGIHSDELGAALMMMELDGWIETLAGCRYRLA